MLTCQGVNPPCSSALLEGLLLDRTVKLAWSDATKSKPDYRTLSTISNPLMASTAAAPYDAPDM